MGSSPKPHGQAFGDAPGEAVAASDPLIVVLDQSGRICQWNQAFERSAGFPGEELADSVFWDLLCFPEDAPEVANALNQLPANANEPARVLTLRRRDGSTLPLSTSVFPIREAARKGRRIVLSMVSPSLTAEHRIADLSLAIVKEQAEELSLISRYIHDTLLQTLVTLSFSTSGAISGTEPQAVDQIQGLIDRACREARTIGVMLSSPLAGEADLSGAIESLAAHFEEDSGLQLLVDLDPPPGSLPADQARVLFAVVQEVVRRALCLRWRREIAISLKMAYGFLNLEIRGVAPEIVRGAAFSAIQAQLTSSGGRFELIPAAETVSASTPLQ